MATTFTQAKATLDEIAQRVNQARNRVTQARSAYGAAQSELAGLSTVYGQFVSDLNAAAQASSWPLASAQKAEKDQLVADFQALKTEVDAIITAIDAV